jgi:formylglycine-generating enzyme required for sulfatase activity
MQTEECPLCGSWWKDRVLAVTDHAISCFVERENTSGSCIVFPKRHVSSVFELNSSEYHDLWSSVYYSRNKMRESFQTNDFIIRLSDWPVSGQYPVNCSEINGEKHYWKDGCDHVFVRIIPKWDIGASWLEDGCFFNRVTSDSYSSNDIFSMVGIAAGEARRVGEIDCIWCPPGSFEMGSAESEEGRLNTELLHAVNLTNGFWISDHAITQSEFQSETGLNPSDVIGGNIPVHNLSWYGAVEYCQRLTLRHRRAGVIMQNWEWRLPTEAEWEYAARAGTKSPIYGDLDEIGWYYKNADCYPQEVKLKQPNSWGIYDMIGNVDEWCLDKPGEYQNSDLADPKGPNSVSYRYARSEHSRIKRGGCCCGSADQCRAAARCWNKDLSPCVYAGFRPVLGLVQ